MLNIAKNNLRHQWTAAHAVGFLVTVWTRCLQDRAEAVKGFAVPCLLDGVEDLTAAAVSFQRHLIPLLLIEAAGDHHHVRADVAAEPTALTGVQGLGQDMMTEVHRSRDGTTVHAYFEGVFALDSGENSFDSRIVEGQHVLLRAHASRLMQQKDDRVDALREVILLQSINGLVDAVSSENVVDICLHPGIQKHSDRFQSVLTAIPTHRHRPAISFAERGDLGRHAVAGSGEVGHHVILPGDPQQILKMLVLVWITTTAQGQLVAPSLALLTDPAEILHGHVRFLHQQTALIAADARLDAQPGFAVDAVAHDAHVDEVGEGGHERVHAGVLSLIVQYAGTDIEPRLRIKGRDESVFVIFDNLFHITDQIIAVPARQGNLRLFLSLPARCTHQCWQETGTWRGLLAGTDRVYGWHPSGRPYPLKRSND